MKCKCGTAAEKKDFVSFSYWYCPTCKDEVKTTTRSLLEEAVDLTNRADGKAYLYVSSSGTNLDNVNIHLINSVDLSGTNVLFYFVRPDGINLTFRSYEGIYADRGCLAPWDLAYNPHKYFKWVNPDTLEIENE